MGFERTCYSKLWKVVAVMILVAGKLYVPKSDNNPVLFERQKNNNKPNFWATNILLRTTDILLYTGIKSTDDYNLYPFYQFVFKNRCYWITWIYGFKELQ